MLAYINGKIEIKTNEYVIADVGGIGYKIFMSESSLAELELGSNKKIFTYMKVREDDISLYGFLNNEELLTFELLISVGGVGAKTAIGILSNIAPSSFALAVISNDVNTLKKLPGIGAKTAQRIILELKDKMKSESAISQTDEEIKTTVKLDSKVEDAMEALTVLGYNRKEIEKVLDKIETKELDVEGIIKAGLKLLGR